MYELIGKKARIENGELYIDDKLVNYTTHQGDCCGYAEVDINLKDFDEGIITDARVSRNINLCNETLSLTIFHEEQTMADIDMEAGSGSGWSYGACAILYLDKEELERVEW